MLYWLKIVKFVYYLYKNLLLFEIMKQTKKTTQGKTATSKGATTASAQGQRNTSGPASKYSIKHLEGGECGADFDCSYECLGCISS